MRASPDRMPLGARLLVTQALVVGAMAAAVVGVALLVGPPAFHAHMDEAGHALPTVVAHAEEAFRTAGLTAMAAGLTVAGLGALAASALLTRRITGALTQLAAGAERIAEGDLGARVSLSAGDPELTSLAASFNTMAERVADTEATRRRMLTDLSHELRTPLAAIELVLEGVEDGVVEADAATLATLRAQTGRLARLAGDLREVSAAEEGRLALQPELLSAAELVDVAIAAARARATRGVRVEAGAVPDAEVRGDRARLGQVLDNLIRNAVQHTPDGGTVWVWADAAGGVLRLGVRDVGSGIAADDLPHVFERFYRGRGSRHDEGAGSGVGLAISRAIVLAHGGKLDAASAGPGQGAEFVVTLPLG